MCCIETIFRLLLKLLKLVSYGIWRTFVSLHFNCLNLELFFFCAFFCQLCHSFVCDESIGFMRVRLSALLSNICSSIIFEIWEDVFFLWHSKRGRQHFRGWFGRMSLINCDIMLRLSWLQLIAFVNWMGVPFDSHILHFMTLPKLWLAKLYFTCLLLGYLRMCLLLCCDGL